MIEAWIFRNDLGNIYGFRVKNHGDPIVCSAVSILSQNTINSIESFTRFGSDSYELELDPDNLGYISFEIPDLKKGAEDKSADLLLKSLELGLIGIEQSYKEYIKVIAQGGKQNVEN